MQSLSLQRLWVGWKLPGFSSSSDPTLVSPWVQKAFGKKWMIASKRGSSGKCKCNLSVPTCLLHRCLQEQITHSACARYMCFTSVFFLSTSLMGCVSCLNKRVKSGDESQNLTDWCSVCAAFGMTENWNDSTVCFNDFLWRVWSLAVRKQNFFRTFYLLVFNWTALLVTGALSLYSVWSRSPGQQRLVSTGINYAVICFRF